MSVVRSTVFPQENSHPAIWQPGAANAKCVIFEKKPTCVVLAFPPPELADVSGFRGAG